MRDPNIATKMQVAVVVLPFPLLPDSDNTPSGIHPVKLLGLS